MIIFKKADDLDFYLKEVKKEGKKIGFVPTMGALHAGHLSLIEQSKHQTDITVCSIFVNPTQFNNKEDFQKYPITIEKDIDALCSVECTILFFPDVTEIYPSSHNKKQYDLGLIETLLEGHYRSGHFQGVCEVVDRLLEIVNPDLLFLGQKDYQQCMVLKKMLQLTGRGNEVKLIIAETVREENGLAMSSRNLRLSSEEKEKATVIYKSLLHIKENINNKSFLQLAEYGQQQLESQGFVVDYVSIANADTLQPAQTRSEPLVVLIAATLNSIRLIDNMLLN